MKKLIGLLLVILPPILFWGGAWAAPSSYPSWAYGVPTKDNEAIAPKDDGTVFTLPGSKGRRHVFPPPRPKGPLPPRPDRRPHPPSPRRLVSRRSSRHAQTGGEW